MTLTPLGTWFYPVWDLHILHMFREMLFLFFFCLLLFSRTITRYRAFGLKNQSHILFMESRLRQAEVRQETNTMGFLEII